MRRSLPLFLLGFLASTAAAQNAPGMSERDALQSVVNRARDNGASALDPRSMSDGEREGLKRIGSAVSDGAVQEISKAASAPVDGSATAQPGAAPAESAPTGPAPEQPFERPSAREINQDGSLANGGGPTGDEQAGAAGPANPEAEAKRDAFLREAAANHQQSGLPAPPPSAMTRPSKKAEDRPEAVAPSVGAKAIVLASRPHNGPVRLLPVLGDDEAPPPAAIGGFESAPRAARSGFQRLDVATKPVEKMAAATASGFEAPLRVVKPPKTPIRQDNLATP